MTNEIERKFLITGDFKKYAIKSYKIVQGFLSTIPERTVRIRIQDDKAFITVKGISNKSGTTRFEWEKEIPIDEAKNLITLCELTIIEKVRYIIPTNDGLFFEIDEFLEGNEGLVIAEIELPSEITKFEKPSWLGEEVTGQIKYYNSMLAKNPFYLW